MQIVSGRLDRRVVHFEALPSAQVPDGMDRYVDWFNRTAPGAEEPLPALTRAGPGHLYFKSIQPFEDGTGRLKRSAFNLRHQRKAERVPRLSRALRFAKICDSGFSRNALGRALATAMYHAEQAGG